MIKRIESFRHGLQPSDDVDFVAYQRKSTNGASHTVFVWMIPRPLAHLNQIKV